MDRLTEEDIKKAAEFVNKVGSAAKSIKPGETTQIPCDCGGILTIGKSPNNGHIHAHCNKCDKALMQ